MNKNNPKVASTGQVLAKVKLANQKEDERLRRTVTALRRSQQLVLYSMGQEKQQLMKELQVSH